MGRDDAKPRQVSARHGGGLLTTIVATLCIGCASPGPPRPPSLYLPAMVSDLAAERAGGRVLLRWTTPSVTTDNLPVKGGMAAEICREAGATTTTAAGRRGICAPILRLAVAPGASEVADTLPRALTGSPGSLISYRVQIFNSAGRSSGESRVVALAPTGPAPAPLEGFSARAGEAGAILEWRRPPASEPADVIDIKEVSLPAQPSRKETGVKAHPFVGKRGRSQATPATESHGNEVHLRAADTGPSGDGPGTSEISGTVVSTAKMGETYTFVAARVRPVTLGGQSLEIRSDPSPAVTLTLRDTFPPRVPSGLAAVPSVPGEDAQTPAPADGRAGKTYIDLSWEPNTEPDLAGYFVYRQLARRNGDPQSPQMRLTSAPITASVYRDMAVTPGQGYIYSVTAVDACGNESAQSVPVQDVAPS